MIKALLGILAAFVVLLGVVWLIAGLAFDSPDQSRYQTPRPPSTGVRTSESAEHRAVAKTIAESMSNPPSRDRTELLHLMRRQMDERGEAATIASEVTPVDAGGVRAEWVVASNANHSRRLLYIHGGGYMMGSPKSHRPITSRMSEISASAVLAVDYRLLPENSRMAGIEDCRTAYRWILENGPDGPSAPKTLIVAGDSAGGNLVLVTIAWVRDEGIRPADAVVALSPPTDATLSSPSLVKNIGTDVIQGDSLGPFVRAPRVFSLWASFLLNRINPSSPLVSPLLGDLSNLPPTLLQASEAEMFLDDAIRYVNKADAQGSLAVLQTWPFVMHVWQAFDVTEADDAFVRIEQFLADYAPETK